MTTATILMLTESKELRHMNLANPNYDLLELKLIPRTVGHVVEPRGMHHAEFFFFLSVTTYGFLFYARRY